jgi:hypothetical protein
MTKGWREILSWQLAQEIKKGDWVIFNTEKADEYAAWLKSLPRNTDMQIPERFYYSQCAGKVNEIAIYAWVYFGGDVEEDLAFPRDRWQEFLTISTEEVIFG